MTFLPRCLFGLSLLAAGVMPVLAATPSYHFLKEIPVGGNGGWDYLSCDAAAHRLYVTHGTKVVVIDTEKDAVMGEIDDTPGVHGFALAPGLGLGFASNGKENTVSIVDLKTLKTKSRVAAGKDPDAILYTSGHREVYAFNGDSRSATVFEAQSGKVIATVALPGKPEFAAYDPSADEVYNNIEDKNEVAVIDDKSHRVLHTWPLVEGGQPTGLSIDASSHYLFVGCRNPQAMLMLDGATGETLGSVPIHAGVDATAFDPGTQLAFASTREGFVTIAHEDSPNKLTVVQNLVTQPGARTMALDVQTHKIYLATAQFAPVPAGAPAPSRPTPVPGTFKILVYGM